MKFFYVLTIALLCGLSVHSQREFDDPTQSKEIPPPPSMWEFEKYGTYPVSKHTGVPNISIPITVAKSGILEVPVSLSYHASGIKVDQKASWVGLGWTLNAGGAITRTVRGGLDEGNKGYINRGFETEGTIVPNTDYIELEDIMLGTIDSEPDVFNYSFLGYSGKFIFNHNTSKFSAEAFTIPHNDLTITPAFSGASIISFTIKTPDGITAEFAYPEGFSEYRETGRGATTIVGNSTWHLKRLTAPNGIDIIDFEYKNVGGNTDTRVSKSYTVNYSDPCSLNSHTVSGKTVNGGTNYSNVKKIEKIIFNNGYLLFGSSAGQRDDDPNDEEQRLDWINIYSDFNSNTSLIKEFIFAYDYFGTINSSNSIPDDREVRLKLTSLAEKAPNSIQKPPHSFTYKDGGTYTTLPPRLTYGQDYWGFYNGNDSNSSAAPLMSYTTITGNATFALGDAYREVDTSYTKAGIIEKIVYPTKGYSTFDFENNVAEIYGTEHYTGGLRIKRIRSYDHDDTKAWEKYYEYTTSKGSGVSSGVYNAVNYVTPNDFLKPGDYYFSTDPTTPAGTCPPAPGPFLEQYMTIHHTVSSAPTIARNFANSFYETVIEYDGNPSGYNGYKVFTYDINKDDHYQTLGPFSFFMDRSWDRGQLLKEETYENGNSSPVMEITNTYETVDYRNAIEAYKVTTNFGVQAIGYVPFFTTIQNSSLQLNSLPGQPGVTDPASFRDQLYLIKYYDEHISWKRLKTSVVVRDGVSSQTDYYYNASNHHINPIRIATTGSDNISLETKRYYSEDVLSDSSMAEGGDLADPDYTVINKLKGNVLHRQNALIQEVTKRNGNTISVNRILYEDDSSQGGVLPKKFQKAKGSNDVATDIIIDERDIRGNVLQYHKEDGTYTSIIWGYDRMYPIAKVVNATYVDIEGLPGFGTDFNISENLSTSQKNYLRSLPNSLVTTYVYDLFIGVTSITAPNGETTHFEYDIFNRFKRVKDDNGYIMSENDYNYKN